MRSRLRICPLLVVALLFTGCTSHRAPRPAHAPPTSRPLASVRFVYTVDENHGEGGSRSTTEIDVADPYVARIVTRSASGQTTGSAWGAAGLLALTADGTARQVQPAPPGFTGGDSHLDVALPLAEALGWVRKGSATTVGGHACTMWRSGPPLDTGSIDPPTRTESTATCVDASGRIIADTWTRDGRVLRIRRLSATGAGPALSPDGLDPGQTPTPLPSTGVSFQVRSVAAARLAPLMGVALAAAPAGQRLDRSTAVALTLPDGSAQQEGASFSYVGAGTLTVVTFTRYLTGAAHPPTSGRPVQLASATGRVVPVLEGLEADLVTSAGLAVKVQTSLPLPALMSWLQQLVL